MKMREGFGKPMRGFSITVSLQAGYGGRGVISPPETVMAIISSFARKEEIEIGGTLRREEIFYAYKSKDGMVWATEPGIVISGLFPPNKFANKSDQDLVAIVGQLVESLAEALEQTSVHAEVCGLHCAWKQEGKKTAHELAKSNS